MGQSAPPYGSCRSSTNSGRGMVCVPVYHQGLSTVQKGLEDSARQVLIDPAQAVVVGPAEGEPFSGPIAIIVPRRRE